MTTIRTAIVGTKYRGAPAIAALAALTAGSSVTLRAERDNPVDIYAVAVYAGRTHIGYVPAQQNKETSVALRGGTIDAKVVVEPIVDKGNVVAGPTIEWEIADGR